MIKNLMEEDDNRNPYALWLWEEYCEKCKMDRSPPFWDEFQEYAARSKKEIKKFYPD